MADGKTIRIKDILKDEKLRIFTKAMPITATPTEWFDKHKTPKNRRFSFTILPMSEDDFDLIRAYVEQSLKEDSFNRSMGILNLGVLDVWKFDSMEDFQNATAEEKLSKMDDDAFEKVHAQQDGDLKSKVRAKQVLRRGKEEIVKSCTKNVFIGKDSMEFEDEEFERLDKDLKSFLYNAILDESDLTPEEDLALR